MNNSAEHLLSSISETNRTAYALEVKREGKRSIGTMCPYTPEEVVYAAGLFPYRVAGTWRANIPVASAYWPENMDRYFGHILESFLTHDLSFLDGVIGSDWCDAGRRCWDILVHAKATPPFAYFLRVPPTDTDFAVRAFSDEIRGLMAALERTFKIRISDDALIQAIHLYDKMRVLLMQIYQFRKSEHPPLSGVEALNLTTAAFWMPKDKYVQELELLLAHLEQRKAPLKSLHPRILVTSDWLFHPGYLELIEQAGGLVVMDDMDTGSRYFWESRDGGSDDPVYSLALRYLTRPACPRMSFWHRQVDQIIEWCRQWNVDGVVNFCQLYSYPRLYGTPYLESRLKNAGIPALSLTREYHLANVGQLRTRLEAFMEMLE